MSYDDVLVLETRLATEKSKNQDHRSFTPAVIRPSSFVTFEWDNSDINPESLRGISIYCTNAIVIQSSGVVQNQTARRVSVSRSTPATARWHSNDRSMKTKKIVPMALELPAYVQVKRRSIEIHTDVPLNLYAREDRDLVQSTHYG